MAVLCRLPSVRCNALCTASSRVRVDESCPAASCFLHSAGSHAQTTTFRFVLQALTKGFPQLGRGTTRKFSPMASNSSEPQTLTIEDEEERIVAHQRAAARLDRSDEARTLVQWVKTGILATNSRKWDGFPVPAIVPYAAEEGGTILLSLTSLSPRRVDIEASSKCSLLVARDLNDSSDLMVTLTGEATGVPEDEVETSKLMFLKKYPEAFWVDFGDFRMFRFRPLSVRYVSGIVTGAASVGDLSGEQFLGATVDPISHFQSPIAHHMNADHADQTRAIVQHSVGISVDSAVITGVDSLGFQVLSQRNGKPLKLRIPFPRTAESRKDVKTLIVEMLAAAENKK